MPLQLLVHDQGKAVRFSLTQGESILGSGAKADLRISHPTVSRRHLRLQVEGGRVEVEDLASRNGTLIDGQRVIGRARLGVGQRLTVGTLDACLESVDEADLQAAVSFDSGNRQDRESVLAAAATTASVGSMKVFTLERLPRLIGLLRERRSPFAVAQAVGDALAETLPCALVEITRSGWGGDAVVFQASHEQLPASGAFEVLAEQDDFRIRVMFRHQVQGRAYRPLVETMGALLALSQPEPSAVPADQRPRPGEAEPPGPPSVVAEVKAIYRDAARVGPGDISILVTGESGTGKEVLARYLHAVSPRRDDAFVALNCAALPRDLLESELFGVEEGVATGVSARPGKFELAHGGTLFLDEIGDMAPATQAKILRVLQEGEVYRLGGQRTRQAQVRVIAATNKDIEAMMEAGTFRRDLYHRVADWRVTLPPLRHRQADIPNLAAWFLLGHAERQGIQLAGISRAALDSMLAYRWPGNIRQLEREMARAVLFLEDGELLRREHLQESIIDAEHQPLEGDTLQARIEALERREIRAALVRNDGNLSAAARELGIARSTLYRRIRELGLETAAG